MCTTARGTPETEKVSTNSFFFFFLSNNIVVLLLSLLLNIPATATSLSHHDSRRARRGHPEAHNCFTFVPVESNPVSNGNISFPFFFLFSSFLLFLLLLLYTVFLSILSHCLLSPELSTVASNHWPITSHQPGPPPLTRHYSRLGLALLRLVRRNSN